MNRRQLLTLVLVGAALPAAAFAADDKKKTGGDSYLQINSITAYTVRPGARRGVLTVECGVDIPDAGLRERADLLLPRLRASFVQVVQIYAGGLPSGMAPNPDFLARNLQSATDTVLGRPGGRVLMGSIMVN